MCGRAYATYSDEELRFRYFNKRPWPWKLNDEVPSFAPNYNMCPTHSTLVLSVIEGTIGFRRMRWGLVPGWARTVKDADKYSMINAKSEEITQKRSFKSAFEKRRCIVPVSGFYEWKRTDKRKQPFAIHLKDNSIMSLAGIWEHWADKDSGEAVDSFCVLTTTADSFMQRIHDRMPVILSDQQLSEWLDPSACDPAKATLLVREHPTLDLCAYEVSAMVNSPKNNSPEILSKLPQ